MGKKMVMLLVMAAFIFLMPGEARADTLLDKGTCGAGTQWELYGQDQGQDQDCRLVISGTGEMSSSDGWSSRRQNISSITVMPGVTSISTNAFSGCSSLETVTIAEGITSIEAGAFKDCTALKAVAMPESVTSIGTDIFHGCSSLASVNIPRKVTAVRQNAFSGCSSLEAVRIPEGVTLIGPNAFSGCSSLKHVAVSQNVKTISNFAFSGCNNLEYAIIPDGVTSIGRSVFEGAGGLTVYGYQDSQIASYCSRNHIPFHSLDSGVVVTLDVNGAGLPFSAFAFPGKAYGELRAPSWTGHTFIGWYTAKEGGTQITADTLVDQLTDHTLYAHWSAIEYTAALNMNGGQASVQFVKAVYGEAYGTLPVPARTGYTFLGWYTAPEGGLQVTADTLVEKEGDHTLYAHWTGAKYKVTLDANGGKAAYTLFEAEYANPYETLPVPARSGYTFLGWYTKAEGGTQVTAGMPLVREADHTLYAHWSSGVYTVKFNANGGTTPKKKKQVVYGGKYEILPTPSRKGYSFAGWFTKKSGGKKITSSTKVTTKKDHRLYARWEKAATLKLTVKLATVSSVRLSWPKVKGAAGYEIYRAASKNGTEKKIKKVKSSTTSFKDTGLQAGKTYYYRVVSFKKVNGSKVSGARTKTASKKILGALSTPVQNIIQINSVNNTFTISWQTVKNAQKIQILRQVDSGAYQVWQTVPAENEKAVYSLAGYAGGHVYGFKLRAYYSVDGVSVYSGDSNGYRIRK